MAALKCNISITILLVCLDYINEKYFSFHTLIWYTFPWEKVFGHQVFPYKRIEECWMGGGGSFEWFSIKYDYFNDVLHQLFASSWRADLNWVFFITVKCLYY